MHQLKGAQTAAEFGFPTVQAKAKQPLRDAAAVNAIYRMMCDFGYPVEVGTGGQTKYNRAKQGYPKTHWLDAVCVGESGRKIFVHPSQRPLTITATGRQSRQMQRVNKFGFPRSKAKQGRTQKGFQTGDMVVANVTNGKKSGRYQGRVAVRSSGSFNIKTASGTVQGISYKYCRVVHHADGYTYSIG